MNRWSLESFFRPSARRGGYLTLAGGDFKSAEDLPRPLNYDYPHP